MKVSRLAYIGAGATDLAAWRSYGTEVLGLTVGVDSDERLLYLRADDRHHRLSIHAGGKDDLSFVGWEVPDHTALEALAAHVEKQGLPVKPGTPNEIADRRVVDLVHFRCPFTDVRMELVVGPEDIFSPGFRLGRDLTGFVTGELGMGHFVLYVPDVLTATRFYQRTLGFGLSDWVVSPERKKLASFLHCNPRHHSMALIEWPNASRRIQHVFFETNSLDDIGTTYDVCVERKLAGTSIGRHPNDRSVSFYFRNPSRWFIEYGWKLRIVDPSNWTAEQYVLKPGIGWGHEGLRRLEG
jgi:2,3-dihydroxybiphenyl 1,2-dioxygenase